MVREAAENQLPHTLTDTTMYARSARWVTHTMTEPACLTDL
jgi:hypothetical protein